jgi:hypothetical protein
MAPVGKRKIFELKCLSAAIQVDKELLQQVAKETGLDAIVIVFALPAVAHQAGHPEQSQMVTDSGLGLAQDTAQGGHMHFPLVRQCQEDFKARFISELLEDPSQARQGSS